MSSDEILAKAGGGKNKIIKDTLDVVSGAVNDPIMGPIHRDLPCANPTCGRSQCVGHFGYIKCPIPFIHPIHRSVAILVLSCICSNCGNIKRKKNNLGICRCRKFNRFQKTTTHK